MGRQRKATVPFEGGDPSPQPNARKKRVIRIVKTSKQSAKSPKTKSSKHMSKRKTVDKLASSSEESDENAETGKPGKGPLIGKGKTARNLSSKNAAIDLLKDMSKGNARIDEFASSPEKSDNKDFETEEDSDPLAAHKPQPRQKMCAAKGHSSSPSPEPIRIPSVSTRIHLVLNGRRLTTVNSTNIDLHNMPGYDEFIDSLKNSLRLYPFRLKEEDIEDREVTFQWLWLTLAKYQSSKKICSNALGRSDHYQSMHSEISATARKNKTLSNQVLRIDISIETDNENADEYEVTGRQSATRDQKVALAARPKSDLITVQGQLRDKLLCHDPRHKTHANYCWKIQKPPFNGKICIPLMADQMVRWADAIVSGAATIHSPPETEEWWDLERKHKPGAERGTKAKGSDEAGGGPNYIFQNFNPMKEFFGAQTPRPQPHQGVSKPSPVRRFNPEEYNYDGLYQYLQWMRDTYEEDEYVELYATLSGEKLGIDIFKSATAHKDTAKELVRELKEDLKIKTGIARRLVERFVDWHGTLPSA